jgi:plastocyanin
VTAAIRRLAARSAFAFLAASVVIGCGAAGASPPPVATSAVSLPQSYRFEPAAITVPTGTAVTWTNADNFTHNVRLAATEELVGQMAPGESVTYTFADPGLYAYDCSLHPNDMRGTVLVRAP